jgi:glucose/arabinose dehydrogenase
VSELHFADDGTAVKGEIVLDLSSEISTLGEGGLLGLAVSNDDKELYLSYTDREMTSQVISMALNSGLPNSDERRTILSLEQPFSNHNGGHLAVDQNGMLFVGFGDGGGSDDPLNYGQDRSNWFGSILRVDPSVESPYGVPEVNPFFGSSEIKEEILVWGLRNPWRYSIDKDTGDLWIGDVGQDHMEEVTWIPYEDLNEGNNLGWPNFEGSRQNRTESLDDHRLPNITYDHSDGRCSVTGGIVYNGADAPEFAGVYIFSDWCDGRIRLASISQDGDVLTYVTDLVVPQVIGFSEGRNGEIYVFSMQGDVFELNAK